MITFTPKTADSTENAAYACESRRWQAAEVKVVQSAILPNEAKLNSSTRLK
jgi:hypothetical protein